MKRSRNSEENILYALKQAESGTPVADVCRQMGISEATGAAASRHRAAPGSRDHHRHRARRPLQSAANRAQVRKDSVVQMAACAS
jgi:hypothetical protein